MRSIELGKPEVLVAYAEVQEEGRWPAGQLHPQLGKGLLVSTATQPTPPPHQKRPLVRALREELHGVEHGWCAVQEVKLYLGPCEWVGVRAQGTALGGAQGGGAGRPKKTTLQAFRHTKERR